MPTTASGTVHCVTQHNATPITGAGWPPWAAAVLERLAQSPNGSRAAESVGVDRSTIYRLRDRDEAFALALCDAREKALDLLEESIFAQATSGLPRRKVVRKFDAHGNLLETTETQELSPNPTLAMFFLRRWRPEYRDSYRVERITPTPYATDLAASELNDVVKDFYAALDSLRPTEGS